MRLLLDTHILIPLVEGRVEPLPIRNLAILEAPDATLFGSVASLWEIAIKHRLGKLPLRHSLDELPAVFDMMSIELLPIVAARALAAIDPEPPTRDPFDRLLLAQCKIEGLRLVTIDRALVSHPYAMV